ncbi:hypothetical protein [Acinetobacter sp. CAAS 2-6]|uniref:hypothetical protein n=1 Tax=Acinetobacter sp. CAAS 2-6 TaxID=3016358 RepID=UPI002DD64499|nr:hypothetical protein [Acinetobacter sp. CAAS 2-6]
MKFKKLLLLSLSCLTFTACTQLPIQSPNAQLLAQVHNIEAFPEADSNQANLLKYTNHCTIEFKANLGTGQATEHWSFKDNQLLSASTQIITENGLRKVTHFDLHDPAKQANFVALRNNFSADQLIACV